MNFFKRAAVAALAALLAFAGAAPSFAAATPGVTADITVRAQGTLAATAVAGAVPSFPFNTSSLLQFSPGTASGQADVLYAATRTIAASGTANIDLAGVLTGPVGGTLTFGHVKAILMVADPTNTNDVVLGGAGSNTFVGPFADATDKIAVKPGATWLISATGTGWAVTAATADILLTANSSSGTSVSYTIYIFGTST